MKEYTVHFHLPGDGLFDHHGTNCTAKNRKEALDLVKAGIPDADIFSVEEGMICLYGAPWADYDATRGAWCAPVRESAT